MIAEITSCGTSSIPEIKEVIGTNQFKLQTAAGVDFTYGGTGGSTTDAFIRYDGFTLKSSSGADITYGGGNGHTGDRFIKSENIRTANTAGQTNNTSATITVGEGHGFKAGDTVQYIPAGTAVQGLTANVNYKVKALIGTTGISLSTLEGGDIAYLGSDGSSNDIFVKANGRIVIKTDPYSGKEYKFDQNWKVKEFVRGTLRLDGWKTAWKDIFSMLENQTETIEDDINKKSEKLLIDNRYQPKEEDRVVLSVKLKAFENNNEIFNSSYFLDEKGSGENTAMGKLVSITLSAAIDLMLEERIQPGVKTAPHDNENIMYFFKILKENNINIQKNNV